MDSMHIIS